MDIVERLLSRIKVNEAGCFEWQGGLNNKGYGQMKVGGRVVKVHRLSYEVFRKAIPPGLFVCHRCDNPLCLNPSHLFLGTAKDNYDDSRSKGRHSLGYLQGHGKLTETRGKSQKAAPAMSGANPD